MLRRSYPFAVFLPYHTQLIEKRYVKPTVTVNRQLAEKQSAIYIWRMSLNKAQSINISLCKETCRFLPVGRNDVRCWGGNRNCKDGHSLCNLRFLCGKIKIDYLISLMVARLFLLLASGLSVPSSKVSFSTGQHSPPTYITKCF